MAQTCICIPFLHTLGYIKIVKIISVHPINTYVCLTNGLYLPWQKLKNNLYNDLNNYINDCKDACTNKNCLKSPILLSHTNYHFQYIYSSFIMYPKCLSFEDLVQTWCTADVRTLFPHVTHLHFSCTTTFLVPQQYNETHI